MKSIEVLDILRELEIKKNEFKNLREISSIKLNSGREIFPDWLHLRIRFLDDHLDIQYGHSIEYGGRISSSLFLSGDLRTVNCQLNNSDEIQIPENPITGKIFREPQFGDTIRVSLGKTILSEAIITEVKRNQNTKMIRVSQPISNDGKFSFFETSSYSKNDYCDHGVSMEGIYMKFIPNKESISKKETIHESIKYRDIASINLNLHNKKKYSLKEREQ